MDIAFGPDGKLWVVEMADYPLGMDGQGKPGVELLQPGFHQIPEPQEYEPQDQHPEE